MLHVVATYYTYPNIGHPIFVRSYCRQGGGSRRSDMKCDDAVQYTISPRLFCIRLNFENILKNDR